MQDRQRSGREPSDVDGPAREGLRGGSQANQSPVADLDGPGLPGALRRLKRWLTDHHMTLMTIADTPHSVALGSAIGIFYGFTPLYPLKTLLSIATAWILRCNKVAAAIAVTLHDVLILAMPAIYLAEYRFGCWVLHRPLSHRVRFRDLGFYDYLSWQLFSRLIWPALVGSLFFAIPSALIVYFLMRMLVSRSRAAGKNG